MYDGIAAAAALAAQLHVAIGARHVSNDSVDWRQNHAIIVDDAHTAVVLVQTSRMVKTATSHNGDRLKRRQVRYALY